MHNTVLQLHKSFRFWVQFLNSNKQLLDCYSPILNIITFSISEYYEEYY